jgi:hypothetical protein
MSSKTSNQRANFQEGGEGEREEERKREKGGHAGR